MDDWSAISRGGYTRNTTLVHNNNNPTTTLNNAYNNQQQRNAPQTNRFSHAVEINQDVVEETSFQLELQRETFDPKSTGLAVSFATANNWIVIGTTLNNLIRWYIEAENDEDEKNIITISNKPEEKIYELYLSPNGKHILISMTNGVLYYIPTSHSITKPLQIQKFKDIVQSVAWFQSHADIVSTGASTAFNPIQRVLLGTTSGSIYELCLEDNHERSIKKFFELPSSSFAGSNNLSQLLTTNNPLANAITGIRIIRASMDEKYKQSNQLYPTVQLFRDVPNHSPRWFLVFVTSSHKHTVYGGPTIEALLSAVQANPSLIKSVELPGGLLVSNQLATFTPQNDTVSNTAHAEHLAQSLIPPSSYGWLTTAGVYYGEIDTAVTSAINTGTNNNFAMIESLSPNERLIDFPKIQDADTTAHRLSMGDGIGPKTLYLQPISHIMSQFHIIFLFRQHLAIVNTVSSQVIMSCPLPKSSFGVTRRLAFDEAQNTLWLLTDTSIYEIIVTNEDKDIWRLYLQQGDYDRAYQHSQTEYQNKLISTYHADYLFRCGEYGICAKQYIRSLKTFESVCMKYLLEYQHFSANDSTTNSANTPELPNVANITNNTIITTNSDINFMPNSLFSSSLSTLFGPNGHFTNPNSSNNPTVMNELSYQQVVGGNSIIEASSLSLLLNAQPSLLAKLGTDSATQKRDNTTNNSTNNKNNNTQHQQQLSASQASSISYFQSAFAILKKKWAIYNGLKSYLKQMLSKLNQSDKTKLTTLSSWVVELYVNTLVSLQTSFLSLKHSSPAKQAAIASAKSVKKGAANTELKNELNRLEEQRLELYTLECTELKEFLDDYLDCLHPTTTYSLLSSAGRTLECIYYAKLNSHHSYALDVYIREKMFFEAVQYLKTLRKVNPEAPAATAAGASSKKTDKPIMPFVFTVDPEIVYRIIPTLMKHHPTEMVDLLVETGGVQSTHVLTAMVRSGLQVDIANTSIKPSATGNFATTSTVSATQNTDTVGHLNALNQKLGNLGIKSTALQQTMVVDPKQTHKSTSLSDANTQVDISVFSDPSYIKSVGLSDQAEKGKLFLHDVSRYLSTLIQSNMSPIAGHNLYVALLIQLLDAPRLHAYLVAHKHTTYPNRVFALRLALPRVDMLFASVIELCLQLQRHTLAIRFALRYDVSSAKRILKSLSSSSSSSSFTLNMNHASTTSSTALGANHNQSSGLASKKRTVDGEKEIPRNGEDIDNNDADFAVDINENHSSHQQPVNIELSLWQEYVQLLLANGYTISQIIQDIRSWNSVNNGETQKMLSTINHNNTALLKILPCLPQSTSIGDIRDNVIQQLTDFNQQLQSLNNDMSLLHQTNHQLKDHLATLQQQLITISVSQRCDVCSQPVLLSPFIYFRCGHAFHIKCSVGAAQQFFTTLSASSLNYINANVMDSYITASSSSSSSKQLSKKQTIYLQMLTNLYDDMTTSSLAQTTLSELDDTTDDAQDLQMIAKLRSKVLQNTLSVDEEIFFIEEYAQQSCTLCGDMMVDSIGLDVTSSHHHVHSHGSAIDAQDWSL